MQQVLAFVNERDIALAELLEAEHRVGETNLAGRGVEKECMREAILTRDARSKLILKYTALREFTEKLENDGRLIYSALEALRGKIVHLLSEDDGMDAAVSRDLATGPAPKDYLTDISARLHMIEAENVFHYPGSLPGPAISPPDSVDQNPRSKPRLTDDEYIALVDWFDLSSTEEELAIAMISNKERWIRQLLDTAYGARADHATYRDSIRQLEIHWENALWAINYYKNWIADWKSEREIIHQLDDRYSLQLSYMQNAQAQFATILERLKPLMQDIYDILDFVFCVQIDPPPPFHRLSANDGDAGG